MASVVQSFEAKELKKRSWSVRLADDLTSIFGSFLFLTINVIFFIFWILANTGNIPNITPFDQFPFPLMTTIVSLEAIILTLIVLMSQNRQSFISNLREEIDMQVNLTSEREITKILQILVKIAEKQGIRLDDKDLSEMLKEIEVSYLERKLEEQLEIKHSNPLQKVVNKVTSSLETRSPKV
ncbi:MAG: hypothetical protein ACD_19C00426G0028 [uncultured bacterium]|nr:MAG: hypothetical protein ACD_19C00426G0028 [uncultured bacterium]